MMYLQLFLSFLQIGMFSIGGGFAALPLIKNQIVDLHGWLTLSQFADVISIAEMTPGPIAINSATFVGIQVAGIPGALIATAGCILPSCAIVMTLALFYQKYHSMKFMQGVLGGLRPAVVGMVASAGVSIILLAVFRSELRTLAYVNWFNVLILLGGLAILRILNLNPIWIIAASGIAGILLYWQQSLSIPMQIAADLLALLTLIWIVYRRMNRKRIETTHKEETSEELL